jgi:hypothetical protein
MIPTSLSEYQFTQAAQKGLLAEGMAASLAQLKHRLRCKGSWMSMQLPHTSAVELAVVVQSKHWTASAAASRGRTAQLSQERVNSGRAVHCRHLWQEGSSGELACTRSQHIMAGGQQWRVWHATATFRCRI